MVQTDDPVLKEMFSRMRNPTTYDEQKEAYAYLAPHYDKILFYAVGHEVAVDRLQARLPTTEGQRVRVLDAGCGTGRAAEYARMQQKRADVDIDLELVGVDYSEEMLAVAKSKNVFDALAIADITRPFSTNGEKGEQEEGEALYDAALIVSVLEEHHVGPEVLLHVMAHVKKGGFAICSIRPFSLKKLRKSYEAMIREAGCKIVAEKEGEYSQGTETAIFLELQKL